MSFKRFWTNGPGIKTMKKCQDSYKPFLQFQQVSKDVSKDVRSFSFKIDTRFYA